MEQSNVMDVMDMYTMVEIVQAEAKATEKVDTRVRVKETEHQKSLVARVVKPITRRKIAVKMSNLVRTIIKAIARP